MKNDISYIDALKKAQQYCANEEKCVADVRRKLYDWSADKNDVDKIIESLETENFIDENRYSQFFARDKFKFNKWGKIKIAYELRMKKIPNQIIQQAFESIDATDYFEMIENEIAKKFNEIERREKDIYQLKSKILKFGQSRGYEDELVRKAIANIKL